MRREQRLLRKGLNFTINPVGVGAADFLLKREDAEGFLQTSQGDVEGMRLFGLVVEAIQAELQEFQIFQELGYLGLLDLALLNHQLLADMPGMAKQGGGTEAMSGSQGAQRYAIDKGTVDFGARGVITDGTACSIRAGSRRTFRHNSTP
jgi:hypothetical protein